MTDIVLAGFRGALQSLESELPSMPLSRWNESVFRYHFCRSVADADKTVKQFVECNRIDLVIAHGEQRAFVEFKFYWKPHRFDPYSGLKKGFKGGPGPQNLREFQKCINQLAELPSVPGLSKYVVLVYADRDDGGAGKWKFSQYYDDYEHAQAGFVSQSIVVSRNTISSPDGDVRANLYMVESTSNNGDSEG